MKYMLMCCAEEKKLNAMSRSEWDAVMNETRTYMEALRKSGHLIASEALQPVETATMVRIRNGKLSTTDGPFAETKEQLGGFWLIDARDLDEAIDVAAEFPSARLGSIEVRPVRDCEQRL
ncbi:MAG: YciI family protein [Gammaproteobacteria bacterium]